jgi:hypothetical protein
MNTEIYREEMPPQILARILRQERWRHELWFVKLVKPHHPKD